MMMDEKAKIPHSTGKHITEKGLWFLVFGPQAWFFLEHLFDSIGILYKQDGFLSFFGRGR
jgi:hypothetical protein